MIQCAVIDDEPLAREGLIKYIQNIDFLGLAGTGTNPMELSEILNKNKVDLIFLDIQMPIINGIEFLKASKNLPMTILTTAYPNYALEGYNLDVLDYLLKPITFDRFFKSALKAKELFELKNHDGVNIKKENNYFFAKCSNKYEKIFFDDILFIQSMQNYVIIQTQEKRFISLINLKTVSQNLSSDVFIQVHKSYIVSIPKITGLESHEISIGDIKIPISRKLRKEITERILGNKLWKNNTT